MDDAGAVEEARAWLFALGPEAGVDAAPPAIREEIWTSWLRSLCAGADPSLTSAPVVRGPSEVASIRAAGPWPAAVARLERDLVEDAAADQLLVVLCDVDGVVVWTGGSWTMGHRTASIGLVPGASWAEGTVGTNALGTALVTGAPVQVLRGEHHLGPARAFAGAAAPVRDHAGGLVGAVGVVGGDHVATPLALALVRSVAGGLGHDVTPAGGQGHPGDVGAAATHLHVLGRERGVLEGPHGSVELSPRHSDLLLSLALAADRGTGRSAGELAAECWDAAVPEATVRAEMHRLRRAVPGLLPNSHPYRLHHRLAVDALDVLALLRRGAHRQAVQAYRGPLLARSTAPGTRALRERVAEHLRQGLVAHARTDVLMEFAERSGEDAVLWQAVVDRLPSGTARHTAALLRLDEIERRLVQF
ncbi:hypothetical protein [Klenkia brasiliensis]|uniref:hypothetical protein n=1 Tax=Klenkia brasiliensis TaxID=333142 RepID=UPI000B82FDC9|nr:hypothetical protein [Klenkia brasiliensis]